MVHRLRLHLRTCRFLQFFVLFLGAIRILFLVVLIRLTSNENMRPNVEPIQGRSSFPNTNAHLQISATSQELRMSNDPGESFGSKLNMSSVLTSPLLIVSGWYADFRLN